MRVRKKVQSPVASIPGTKWNHSIKCGGDQQGNKFLVLFNVFGYDSKSIKVNYYFNTLWNSCFA